MTASSLDDTRTAYDGIAEQYAALFTAEFLERPLDLAMLNAFGQLTRGSGPVADLGCGPGHLTGHLRSLGCDAWGADLSPEMVRLARAAHPGVRFEEVSMTELEVPDGSLGGVLAWYSLIHLPPDEVPGLLARFHRMLAPGGHLMLGFFASDTAECVPFDHKVTLAHRWPIDRMAAVAEAAGFAEVGRMRREAHEGERHRHGRLVLRRPA